MISGEYEIKENELDNITHTERTMKIELCVVTYEPSKKNADAFLDELQELLNKYAIQGVSMTAKLLALIGLCLSLAGSVIALINMIWLLYQLE